jgi:hypothetical protein
MRLEMSTPPPGANGTMKRTGLDGYVCAKAALGACAATLAA